jgi:hypothetical protein
MHTERLMLGVRDDRSDDESGRSLGRLKPAEAIRLS